MSRAPLPPEVIELRGTRKPTRPRERIVEPISGEPKKPTWLKGRAARIWREKLATYARRGQSAVGLEGPLAQYAALEAHMIALWQAGRPPTAAQLMAYKQMCAAFYDLPSAQVQTTKTKDNQFAQNGQRPEEPTK